MARNPTVVEFPKMPDLPKVPPGGVRLVLLAIVAAVLIFGSVYTIDPEEVGVVLRFGKYKDPPRDPGLNFKLPLGIDRVIKVPVQRQLKQEFGFRTQRAGVRSQFTRAGLQEEANMLTGDLNAAVVEWVVQFRVQDAKKYLFKVRAVEDTLHDMSEAVMRQVVGDRTVDEVLTVGRQEVADLAEAELQRLCDQYENGVKIEQVVLQDVNPPEAVKASFNEVNQAEQERETKINEAQKEYNTVMFSAEGEAEQTISNAEGYALDRVNRARGEAARFNSVFAEYRKAPEVTRRRIYLETMNEILPRMGQKTVLDGGLEGVLPLLDLGAAGGAASQSREDQ